MNELDLKVFIPIETIMKKVPREYLAFHLIDAQITDRMSSSNFYNFYELLTTYPEEEWTSEELLAECPTTNLDKIKNYLNSGLVKAIQDLIKAFEVETGVKLIFTFEPGDYEPFDPEGINRNLVAIKCGETIKKRDADRDFIFLSEIDFNIGPDWGAVVIYDHY
jgi:hypothetical protein